MGSREPVHTLGMKTGSTTSGPTNCPMPHNCHPHSEGLVWSYNSRYFLITVSKWVSVTNISSDLSCLIPVALTAEGFKKNTQLSQLLLQRIAFVGLFWEFENGSNYFSTQKVEFTTPSLGEGKEEAMTESKLGKYSPNVLFYGPCALFPTPCPFLSPTITLSQTPS